MELLLTKDLVGAFPFAPVPPNSYLAHCTQQRHNGKRESHLSSCVAAGEEICSNDDSARFVKCYIEGEVEEVLVNGDKGPVWVRPYGGVVTSKNGRLSECWGTTGGHASPIYDKPWNAMSSTEREAYLIITARRQQKLKKYPQIEVKQQEEVDVKSKVQEVLKLCAGGQNRESVFPHDKSPMTQRLQPLLDSKFLGVTKHNRWAKIRLFCLADACMPAAAFRAWVGDDMHRDFPDVEIAVLDFPGHGSNTTKEPFDNYINCAQAVTMELYRIFSICDVQQPFALYGNSSLGARIAAEVAATFSGPNGEQCKKLYVSARGAPHMELSQGWRVPDVTGMSPKQVRGVAMHILKGAAITKAQFEEYSLWMDGLIQQGKNEALLQFARVTIGDIVMGTGAAIPSRALNRGMLRCPVHYYHGEKDKAWPLHMEGLERVLPETWAKYTTGGFTWSECLGASHEDMCSVRTPALPLICQDLSRFVKGG